MKLRKVVIVGGGSYLWAPRSVASMALVSAFKGAEIVLMDISRERADEVAQVINGMLARAYPASGITCRGEVNLDACLPGADLVFSCFQNLGKTTEKKADAIAQRYGAKENSFSAGPGMVLYLAVQGPVMVDLVRRMRQHCPDALLLNCANPMPALCMVAIKAGWPARQVMGVDGVIDWNRLALARFLKVAKESVTFRTAGTNHLTFAVDPKVDGRDASARLAQRAEEQPWLDIWCWGRSETEVNIYKATGCLALPGHASDLMPTLAGAMLPPDPASIAESPLDNRVEYTAEFPALLKAYAAGASVAWAPPTESIEPFLSLSALDKVDQGRLTSGHMMNDGAIPNLPEWAVLELELYVDARGLTPLAAPAYPDLIAETVRRQQVTFEMAARGVVEGNVTLLKQAIQLVPFGDYWRTAENILAEGRDAFGPEFIPA